MHRGKQVRQLTSAEREDLWRDYVCLGELFGLPREHALQTYTAFRSYYRARLGAHHRFDPVRGRVSVALAPDWKEGRC